MKYALIFFVLFVSSSYSFSGFSHDTLVLTPQGLRSIQTIQTQQFVLGIHKSGAISPIRVSHVAASYDAKHIVLTIDGRQKTTVARCQKFFVVGPDEWVKAKKLNIGHKIKTVQSPGYSVVTEIKNYDHGITLYDLRLDNADHIFCVSSLGVIVHNVGLFTIGFLWLFNTFADISFEAIILKLAFPLIFAGCCLSFEKEKSPSPQVNLSVAGASIKQTVQDDGSLKNCGGSNYQGTGTISCGAQVNQVNFDMFCSCKSFDQMTDTSKTHICHEQPNVFDPTQGQCGYSKNKGALLQDIAQDFNVIEQSDNILFNQNNARRHIIKESEHEPGKWCSPECNPPPKGPYGYFIPSDKHKSYQQGNASPGPSWEDGQKALDRSIRVVDKRGNPMKTRIVIHNGKFLVFFPTLSEVWHGHYRPWDDLEPEMQESLRKVGLVTGDKGKIVELKEKNNDKIT